MVYYNVSMQHTEKTFEKLAHMQYDLFCRSNLIVRSMLGMGAVVLGVVNFSEWWGAPSQCLSWLSARCISSQCLRRGCWLWLLLQ